MSFRYDCRVCANPICDSYVCPACGEIGPKSSSPEEDRYIMSRDIERFGKLVKRYWQIVERGEYEVDG